MSVFTPPARDEVSALAVDTRGPAKRLMRYFDPTPRGVNIYYLSDGSVTDVDPDSETVFWDQANGSPYVAQAWWGSTAAPYELTAAQADALTAADYTVS